jgi:hypothetical protein
VWASSFVPGKGNVSGRSPVNLKEKRLAATHLKSMEVVVLVVWLCTVLGTIVTLPDYERYRGRVERMERLLRTHCSGWTLVKDVDYVPAHELMVIKCFPK